MTKRESIHFAGFEARAGRKTKIEVPVAKLMSGTPVALPLLVLHGRSEGPTIWLSAAIHGDEVVGV